MSSIIFHIEDNIAFISFNRPDKLNAFNSEMALCFQQYLDEAASLKEVRAVYITGKGKGFSAGQDLAELEDPNGPGFEEILRVHYNPIIKKIRNIAKPVVAAVNGVAAGAGANIALACDIVLAKQGASFIQSFSKIGLIPDCGGTFFLPRLVGFQQAAALMMLGEKISAQEAHAMGMIYKVFDNENFEGESISIARELAKMPTKSLAYIKHALNQSMHHSLEMQLELEDQYQQKAALSKDFKEGLAAFHQKRTPVFKGE